VQYTVDVLVNGLYGYLFNDGINPAKYLYFDSGTTYWAIGGSYIGTPSYNTDLTFDPPSYVTGSHSWSGETGLVTPYYS
jgi:hypothetical protein